MNVMVWSRKFEEEVFLDVESVELTSLGFLRIKTKSTTAVYKEFEMYQIIGGTEE